MVIEPVIVLLADGEGDGGGGGDNGDGSHQGGGGNNGGGGVIEPYPGHTAVEEKASWPTLQPFGTQTHPS